MREAMLDIKSISIGTKLPELRREITQPIINSYAEVSHDFNPIHIDPIFASKTPAGGTIAHGMLSLAYISQMMLKAFGIYWIKNGKLDVRFKNPARPDDLLIVNGQITSLKEYNEIMEVTCEVKCTNQLNEPIVIGETFVRLSR